MKDYATGMTAIRTSALKSGLIEEHETEQALQEKVCELIAKHVAQAEGKGLAGGTPNPFIQGQSSGGSSNPQPKPQA